MKRPKATMELDHDTDLDQLLQSLTSLRDASMSLLSPQTHDSASASPSQNQSLVFAYAAQLRSLHRRAVLSVRDTKQDTSEARSEVDRLNLQLQNLVYEQRHLRGEITACEEYEYVTQSVLSCAKALTKYYFSHKYTSLPLTPEKEYKQLFPEHADLNEHDLMIARIAHEYTERQALEERRQGLLKMKQGLIAENNRRKEDLANLDKDLELFIAAADPIIKTFEKEY
jgi:THO complex subunit 5